MIELATNCPAPRDELGFKINEGSTQPGIMYVSREARKEESRYYEACDTLTSESKISYQVQDFHTRAILRKL